MSARGRRPPTTGRLRELELALAAREPPVRGPLADSALWNVEVKLARGETAGVVEQLDAIEQRRGTDAGVDLPARARLADDRQRGART